MITQMKFSISQAVAILERTPAVLHTMLESLSEDWTFQNEGGETWSVFDIVGHLIHGEKTDWVPRAEIILYQNAEKKFQPYDRFAQFENSKGKTLPELLIEFSELRKNNIQYLRSKQITEKQLEERGIHPAFGEVTLSQLLATWVVHDLNHISQIARVMAKQYREEVGPWIQYLGILKS